MSKDHGYHIFSENLDIAGHFDTGCDIVNLKIKKSWLLYKYYIPKFTGHENVNPLFSQPLYVKFKHKRIMWYTIQLEKSYRIHIWKNKKLQFNALLL